MADVLKNPFEVNSKNYKYLQCGTQEECILKSKIKKLPPLPILHQGWFSISARKVKSDKISPGKS